PYTPKLEGRITEASGTQLAAGEAAKPAEAAPATPAVPAPPAASGDIATTPPTVPSEAAPAQTAPAQPAPAEAAPAQAAAPAQSGEASHVIVAGDTYWDIAKKTYGDGAKWKTISSA
ncbi:LysM peptidoglycan-binding domain-containing protein, partial [Rhizobiaceae sp. 2RAB30]